MGDRLQVSVEQESSSADTQTSSLGFTALLTLRLELAPREVHLWRAPLADHLAEGYKHLLSGDEVSRAARFQFAKDRNQFIAGRALLRLLLSAYSGIAPAALRFAYAEQGKPSLADSPDHSLHFNLAHSNGLALFAFAGGQAVGVDLEFIRKDVAHERIAERFFSPHEVEMLRAVPDEARRESFFVCWTRKEAYLKARGAGLSLSLAGCDVSLRPGEPAAVFMSHDNADEPERWIMRSVPMPSGYVATLVVAGQDPQPVRNFALE